MKPHSCFCLFLPLLTQERPSVDVIVLCLLMTAVGCGSASIQQPTYPASGVVTLDGKPVKNALVVLHAIDKSKFKWDEVPQGTTDEQGRFSLFTYAADDGAPAGEYKVGIAVMGAAEEDGSDQVKHERLSVKIPTRYANAETSGIKVTIEKQKTTLEPFALSSK